MLSTRRVRNYLSIMQSMGFDSASVLLGSDIDAARIADSTYLIDTQQCRVVIKNMIQLTGNPGIGLDIGSRTELVNLGIIGYAIATCRAIRDTCEIWENYSNSLLGVMSRYDLKESPGGDVTITFVEPSTSDSVFTFCVEELLTLTCKVGYMLSGVVPHCFVRIELPYPPPAYSRRYDELFNCPIHFGADVARVVISKHYLSLPLIAKNDELHEVYIEHCGQIMSRLNQSNPIATRVRNLFLSTPQQLPALEDVAHTLAMSCRTLRRRLRNEGYSYQLLVRDFKIDLAHEYLTSTDLAPKKIAFLLGFDNVQAFRRAFKSWTGKTPGEYRLDPPTPLRTDKTLFSQSRTSSLS